MTNNRTLSVESCKTCVYGGESFNAYGSLQCRRHAPTPWYEAGEHRCHFPIVHESYWCGDYKPDGKRVVTQAVGQDKVESP